MILSNLSAVAFAAALSWAPPANFPADADALVQSAYPADGPGAAVIVTVDGKPAYVAARGIANVESDRPITPDTVFRLGSITKQFTAAVILQLVDEGKLGLDDPLSKYLPDYPSPGGSSTVAQLLNHSSGIQSYTGIPGTMTPAATAKPLTTAQLVDLFKDHPQNFAPGTRYDYNNSGYILLGAIIEKVTGKAWHEAVDERLIKPLGLSSIAFGGHPQGTQWATGYTARGGEPAPSQPIDMTIPHAAGALVGTVRDLARWNEALHGGKVVSAQSYRRMIAPTTLKDGREVPYAFGLRNDDIRGRASIGHSGGIFGFSTASSYLPADRIFVAVFANSDSPATSTDLVMNKLAALALGDPYPVFSKADVPMAEIEPLFGVYAGGDVERSFFERNGKYFTRRKGAADSQVFAAGKDRFFYGPESLTWFAIVRDPDGKHRMEMHQMGASKPEVVVRTGPVPPPPAAIAVSDAELKFYAGDYKSPAGPIEVRLSESGTLTLRLSIQSPVALVPVARAQFKVDVVDATVDFIVEDGKVSGLVLKQGGQEVKATRVTPG